MMRIQIIMMGDDDADGYADEGGGGDDGDNDLNHHT